MAVAQIESAYSTLLARPMKNACTHESSQSTHESTSKNVSCVTQSLALDAKSHPLIVTLGGDHAIVSAFASVFLLSFQLIFIPTLGHTVLKLLPILRSLRKVYGPITVIHFDSHLDTWPVQGYYGSDDLSTITHGTFFWTAARENLMKNGTCVHAGIRCKLQVHTRTYIGCLSAYYILST